MPDLDWKNPDVLTKIESIFDYWAAQGIYGFRLDAANFLIGEVWDNAAHIAGYYGHGDELDAAFDFPVEASIRSSLVSHDSKDFVNAHTEKLTALILFTLPGTPTHYYRDETGTLTARNPCSQAI